MRLRSGGAGLILGSAAVLVAVLAFPSVVEAPLRAAGELVTRSDPDPKPADFIYVLNGSLGLRSRHAIRLYQSGYAPRLVIAETGVPRPPEPGRPRETQAQAIASVIVSRGIPLENVEIIPGDVSSTVDEALALRAYLLENPAGHVLVATTDYHAGRAGWIIRRALRDLPTEVTVVGAQWGTRVRPDNWWRTRTGWRVYGLEIAKWVTSAIELTLTR